MSYFKVLKAGVLTTIQDLGRFGYADIGISQSGAMDEEAFLWCNKLLQNSPNTNMIEITYGNFEIESFGNSIFCLTGAKADIWLNDKKIERYRCYKITKGDRLKIGFVKSGVRVYFGIKGGFLDKKELNSYSVSIKEDIKRAIKNNDKLLFNNTTSRILSFLKQEYIPKYSNNLTLRVLLGYESRLFKLKELEHFFKTTYTIKSHNRMGYILNGLKIDTSNIEIISNPIAFGSIQITTSGNPIILLKERQSIGGYPKIGSIIPTDCFKLSQLKEGNSINFKEISLKEATKITKNFYKQFF